MKKLTSLVVAGLLLGIVGCAAGDADPEATGTPSEPKTDASGETAKGGELQLNPNFKGTPPAGSKTGP